MDWGGGGGEAKSDEGHNYMLNKHAGMIKCNNTNNYLYQCAFFELRTQS